MSRTQSSVPPYLRHSARVSQRWISDTFDASTRVASYTSTNPHTTCHVVYTCTLGRGVYGAESESAGAGAAVFV